MADATNTTGNVDGEAVQVGTVGRDVTINFRPPKRSLPLRIAAVAVAVVAALLLVVANLGSGTKPVAVIAAPSSAPPPASVPSSAVAISAPVPTQPPVVPQAQPSKPPAPTVRQQPVVPQQQPTPAPTTPVNDGPGYLLPSNTDQKAIDFYDNQFHDAVMWDRHPPGTEPSYQPHWVREFSGAGVFRVRNEQVNRCLEPVSDPERGDHVVANVCSGVEAQQWRVQKTAQYASVKFGGCLSVANNGSYDNGTWLYIANCTGTPDQLWRVAR